MKFSVLVPAYKRRFLRECLSSILNQSFGDFEVIVLDDNSPEDLDSVLNKFNDTRIKIFKNTINVGAVGIVDNWNKCLELASGDYVLCMGDDDCLKPNCLSIYKDTISLFPECNVLHCRTEIINEYSEIISLTPGLPTQETVLENMWQRIHFHRDQFIGDFLYKREPLISKGGFFYLPLALGSDDITSYLAMWDSGIVHVNLPLFCYRRSNLTISTQGFANLKFEAINGEEQWLNTFISSYDAASQQDLSFLDALKIELPHYFKQKRKDTLVFYGLLGGDGLLTEFLRLKKVGALKCFSIVDLFMALCLAIKKKYIPKTR